LSSIFFKNTIFPHPLDRTEQKHYDGIDSAAGNLWAVHRPALRHAALKSVFYFSQRKGAAA